MPLSCLDRGLFYAQGTSKQHMPGQCPSGIFGREADKKPTASRWVRKGICGTSNRKEKMDGAVGRI